MMVGDGDVAYGVPVLVPPSRKVSLDADDGDAVTNDDDPVGSKKTTAAHIHASSDGDNNKGHHHQLNEKDERIRALEQQYAEMESKYKSELQNAKNEQMELQSTIHLMQTMLDDAKGMRAAVVPNNLDASKLAAAAVSAPVPTSSPAPQNNPDSMESLIRRNEDLKFRIQQQAEDKIELKNQLKIATADARDAEKRLRNTLEERDHAMEGVDKERIWMSTQLSNCEQQIHQLQNENIFLLNTVQEEQDKREQMMEAHLEELEQVRREEKIPIVAATTTVERKENDNSNDSNDPKEARQSKRVLRFTRLKTKAKRAEDQRKKLAFDTAKAYFAHQQHKRNEREDYNSTHPFERQRSASSFPTSSLTTNSERAVPPSSKGQADLLARHILEQQAEQPTTTTMATMMNMNTRSSKKMMMPLTLMDEIELKTAEQKRRKALTDTLLKHSEPQ